MQFTIFFTSSADNLSYIGRQITLSANFVATGNLEEEAESKSL